MKKGIKLLLAILMVVSVCSSFMLVASAVGVPQQYLNSSNYVISDGTVSNASQPIVKDGKITFKINMASGLTVTEALVTVKYDKNVLEIVDAGPVMTKDADGNEKEVVTGMHTQGVPQYDDSAYTFAYISTNGYKTGNSGKEFVFITFKVKDITYPLTTVEFFAGDYTSTDSIKKFENFATVGTVTQLSFAPGNKSIVIKWDAIPSATEYLIYRKGGEDKNFRKLSFVSGIKYTDTENIVNGTKYTYAVRAKNEFGFGWYVGTSFTYLDTVNLTVTNTSSGVKIAWDVVEGATKYRIYKRVYGEEKWEKLTTVESNVLTVTDKKVTSGVKYQYTAKAFKDNSYSALADVKSIQYVGIVSKVTLENGSKGVSIKWSAVDGAEKYRIYRRLKGESAWTTLKTVDGSVLKLTDTGATSGTTNYYAVKVYSKGAWSSYKSYAINYLAAPVATKAYATVGTGNIIKWKAVPGAAKYQVYRKKTADKKWTSIGKTTATSFTDKNVKLGETFIYTLKAENGKNLSSYNSKGWTIKYTLSIPVISKITPSSNSIKIQWSSVKGADGYRLYRKTAKDKKWTTLKNTTSTSYTDEKVKAGTVYYYTVKAYKGKTFSERDKTNFVGVILKTPTVKIANASDGVKVSWSKITGAASYVVYSSQYNTSTKKWSSWEKKGTTKSTVVSLVDKKVTSGVKYKYMVRAINGTCKSAYKASAELLYLGTPTVKISNSATGITVKWSEVKAAKSYKIYRSELNVETGKWTSLKNIATAKSTAISWVDKTVVNGVNYKYTVRSVNGKLLSGYKATGGLMFLETPVLSECVPSVEGVVLKFEQNPSAESYKVYRKTLYTNWILLEEIEGAENTTYTDMDVIAGTEYTYTVKAINKNSESYYDRDGISVSYPDVEQ